MSEAVLRELGDEYGDVKSKNAKVLENRDNYEAWIELVTAAEQLEGGLNRNSDPNAISAYRNIMNAFLYRYPLFFGYWKRYADTEFNISGTEAAELIYERGIASIHNSSDLYTNYCAFKMDTSHDQDATRELFERAASAVGTDPRAETFWDKYLEFETRQEQPDRGFALLYRIIHIPLLRYQEYYERFSRQAASRSVERLGLSNEVVEQCRKDLEAQYKQTQTRPLNDLQRERDLHARLDMFFAEIHNQTRSEVAKRWTFETEKIQRNYYLPQELPETELQAWRDYLTFEENEKDDTRTTFLYERCLVACANYDEFWLRYARWMFSRLDRQQDVRNIYNRACCIHVPISAPTIRFLWAKFEESLGNVGMAQAIYNAVIESCPGMIEPIVELANMERRQGGLDAAIKVYRQHIDSKHTTIQSKGWLVSEWAQLLWKIKGSPSECRTVYTKNAQYYREVPKFWLDWFSFELAQPTAPDQEPARYDQIKKVFTEVQKQAQLPPTIIHDMAHEYQLYLSQRGTADAMKEYMQIDREFNSPAMLAAKNALAGEVTENGQAKVAETPYASNGQAGALRFSSR